MLYTGIYRRHGDCKCSQHNQTLEYQMSQLESHISWTVKIDIEFYPGNSFFRLLIVMHIEYSDERAQKHEAEREKFFKLGKRQKNKVNANEKNRQNQ